MSITQVGVATVSDELIAHIKQQIKNGTIEWNDLVDTPDYSGNDGRFLKANSGGGSSSIEWSDLPPSGLNWVVQSSNVTVEDKTGYLSDGGITITLSEEPEVGTIVAVSDRNGEFDVSPVTIESAGGYLIEEDSSLLLDLKNSYVQLVFDGVSWKLTQVNHPFNVQEVTEESFPGGQIEYTLSRVPPNRSSILVSVDGYIIPTSQYSVAGNTLSFGSAKVGTIYVRHIGVPKSSVISDVPIGAMMYFPNGEAVDGWLDCTGSTVHKSVYPDLVRYLTKDDDAETANLPDSRGNFIRTWDHGTGIDTVSPINIPNVLSDNRWGKWLDTLDTGTAVNLWDANLNTRTTVNYVDGYVGYRFDAPVSVNSIDITTNDVNGSQYVPTSLQLKASNDGVTWINVSGVFSGSIQNQTVTMLSSTSNSFRYWAVFGTGGLPHVSDSSRYWGVTGFIVNGTSIHRLIGGYQEGSVGDLEVSLNETSAGTGEVQSGTGATAIVTGGSDTVSGGDETRPNNQAYILRIKAFHYQGGSLSGTNVSALIQEVSRLSTEINDIGRPNNINSSEGFVFPTVATMQANTLLEEGDLVTVLSPRQDYTINSSGDIEIDNGLFATVSGNIVFNTVEGFFSNAVPLNSIVFTKAWQVESDKLSGTYVYDTSVDRSTADGKYTIDNTVVQESQGTGSGTGAWVLQTGLVTENIDAYLGALYEAL